MRLRFVDVDFLHADTRLNHGLSSPKHVANILILLAYDWLPQARVLHPPSLADTTGNDDFALERFPDTSSS